MARDGSVVVSVRLNVDESKSNFSEEDRLIAEGIEREIETLEVLYGEGNHRSQAVKNLLLRGIGEKTDGVNQKKIDLERPELRALAEVVTQRIRAERVQQMAQITELLGHAINDITGNVEEALSRIQVVGAQFGVPELTDEQEDDIIDLLDSMQEVE